jgi:hypothetical protein
MNSKYIVTLTEEERLLLKALITKRSAKSPVVLNAQLLLACDKTQDHSQSDEQIATTYYVSEITVRRIRQKFVLHGIDIALRGFPRGPHTRKIKIDGEVEAHLLQLACSPIPEGYNKWSLRLLADKAVEFNYVGSISHEGVRQTLKKTKSSPGSVKCG